MEKRVLILYKYLPQWRKDFFNKLKESLARIDNPFGAEAKRPEEIPVFYKDGKYYYKDQEDTDEVERLQEEIKRLENMDLNNRVQLKDFVEESMYSFGDSFRKILIDP